MSRTGVLDRLRRLLAAAHVARRTGQRPADVLAAAAARRPARRDGPSRRAFLGQAAGAAALLPLVGCGDNASGYDVRATVAVVGGGIAGLHCAYRLAEAGVDVVLFEASDRTGGRMYTARDAFPEGQLCELGGELVDTDHEVIQILCGELGLTLDDLPAETAGLRADTFHFDGGVLDEQDLADAFTPLAATMAATVAAAEADDAEFARVDAMSIPAWLEGEAGLAAGSQLRKILEITYTGEYGLEADEQSIFNLLYLIDYDTPDPFHIFGDSDERFHVHEGNDAVPAALAAALPDGVIRLDHALVRVVATGDGYDLSFRTGGGDVAVAATHVVFALPFTKLREVDLVDSGLPADKRTIIDELGYGTNAKLMLGFDTRAWATGSGAAGGSYTDVGELQSTWDSTRGQAGARGILTNFVGGARGLSIGDGSAESQAAIVVPWVDTVFPGAAAAYTADSAVRMHWPTHPFTRGSYACYRPGQWAFFGLEGQRAGDLHFCGEHTSEDFQGYMEGGAETGLAVAMEILDDLGVAPSARAAAIATRVLRRPRATYHAGLWRGERRRWRRQQRRRLAR